MQKNTEMVRSPEKFHDTNSVNNESFDLALAEAEKVLKFHRKSTKKQGAKSAQQQTNKATTNLFIKFFETVTKGE